MTVTATAEKNFRRARGKPVRRAAGRGRRWWRIVRAAAAAALAGAAVYYAGAFVARTSVLRVRHIAVHGNARLSAGEVQALVDELRGANILFASLSSYRARLRESPWVADVALRRVLPSDVEVFVSERRPMGLCRLGSHLYLIDRRGVIIDEFGPQYAEFDLPIVDGLMRSPAAEPSSDEARADLASRVIDSIAARKDLAGRLSQIDVANVHDAAVLLDDDPAWVHLGEERFVERLGAYVEMAPSLHAQVRNIEYVDVRFGERVYVRPAERIKGDLAAGSSASRGR
jgi:cell division protein FtsQ